MFLIICYKNYACFIKSNCNFELIFENLLAEFAKAILNFDFLQYKSQLIARPKRENQFSHFHLSNFVINLLHLFHALFKCYQVVFFSFQFICLNVSLFLIIYQCFNQIYHTDFL